MKKDLTYVEQCRTVAVFEEFLLSEYGEHSEELLGYHLWRAVTSCLAQKNKEKREAMALKIQQKYIFTDSEHHVDLSGSQLDLVDPMQEVERPCTAALHGIQSAAAKILSKLVENYLLESGEMKDSIGSFVSLNYKPRESVANKVSQASGKCSCLILFCLSVPRCACRLMSTVYAMRFSIFQRLWSKPVWGRFLIS